MQDFKAELETVVDLRESLDELLQNLPHLEECQIPLAKAYMQLNFLEKRVIKRQFDAVTNNTMEKANVT